MAGGEGEGEGGKTLPSVDHALSPRGRGKKKMKHILLKFEMYVYEIILLQGDITLSEEFQEK